ncbi:3-oxoacyl-ACP reductase family protein [Pseudomonas sp. YuFO20]|uniref:SDR family NAD(P)-dependent oxidoreductase n=1 Tax=Pseudomonas sp. YuFO20 TaxID=3095362 RepID=UPI002B24089F|nr:3-oxoacyl-ACP reductase family protein [Pseudomonas sp. YuFO20]MEB2516275.1 3-oxoacyl-ACP reductase family protein [Pseudomonas sp. YuFO20]
MKRVVVITGAARGIGLAIARRFAASGDHLVLNYFDTRDQLDEVIRTAEANGGDGITIQADISNPESAAGILREAESRYGRVDILVNSAGRLVSATVEQTTWAQWEQMISTNLGGTWACMQAVLPGMLARGQGRIINISSELGLIGFPTYAAYCASKGGVIALTKAVAKEVAPKGVLVNSVAPGPIETDMLINDTLEFNDETRASLPLRRFGKPDEIAAMVEALAGPAGDYMVGQIISPNGGAAI